MPSLLLAAALLVAPADEALIRDAIEEARESTAAELIRPYVFVGGIVVETPFLRVALQARDALDKYLPFSPADVSADALAPEIVITARDEKHSFKHLVIAVPNPNASPTPVTQTEVKGDWRVQAAVARARARQAEDARRTSMTVRQPTAITTTEHVWQNAFSATFRTEGVRARFPLELLAEGNQIRAIKADGAEVLADLTAERLKRLR